MPDTFDTRVFRMYQPEDAEPLGMLLSTALFAGPLADWLVPDASRRMDVYQGYFRVITGFALDHGIVYGTPDFTGAAIWIDALNGARKIDDFDDKVHAVCGPYTEQFNHLHRLFDRVHPRRPHWYLMFLAVGIGHQGKGLGSALLRHHHQGLDEHRLPAYLEASNVHNRRLYLRHGYVDLNEAEADTLPGGPPIYPMWREPQSLLQHLRQ